MTSLPNSLQGKSITVEGQTTKTPTLFSFCRWTRRNKDTVRFPGTWRVSHSSQGKLWIVWGHKTKYFKQRLETLCRSHLNYTHLLTSLQGKINSCIRGKCFISVRQKSPIHWWGIWGWFEGSYAEVRTKWQKSCSNNSVKWMFWDQSSLFFFQYKGSLIAKRQLQALPLPDASHPQAQTHPALDLAPAPASWPTSSHSLPGNTFNYNWDKIAKRPLVA